MATNPGARQALMMATMEPAIEMDGEFNDWYDSHHLPSRIAVPGFLTGTRLVCIEGWPRYAVMYDLKGLDVLNTPAYQAIGGKNTAEWSRRLIAKARGYFRVLGEQVYPGNACLGDQGNATRILFMRFAAPTEDAIGDILPGLKAAFEGKSEVAQFRLFRSEFGGLNYAAIIELRRPIQMSDIDVAVFGRAARFLDLMNVYIRYFHKGASAPGAYS